MIRILIANLPEETRNYQRAMDHLGFLYTCTNQIPDDADSYDALILPGGGDIDPVLFHRENEGSRGIDRPLDEVQLALFHRFMEAGKPILGICKGCQVINVGLGGDLIQDLSEPYLTHHCYHADHSGEYHLTKIEPGTFLHDIYGDEVVTNSFHHQALGSLGEGLRCIQKCYDGIPEMIVHESLPIIGSQWHPEIISWESAKEGVADGAPFFRYFASLVRKNQADRKGFFEGSASSSASSASLPVKPTLRDFLTSALSACGKTLYVWGGGWNPEDTGAGQDAVTLGVSPAWKKYFDENAGHYDYSAHRFEHENGLDCSGFVGWALYQTFEEESGHEPGYVMSSTTMAETFAGRGWGRLIPDRKNSQDGKNGDASSAASGSGTADESIPYYLPGDIVSLRGHVWISLGQFRDGSVLLLHSTPNGGVQISGTVTREGHYSSLAMAEATRAMYTYFPDWTRHYSAKPCGPDYLKGELMRWNLQEGPLCDPEGLRSLRPGELVDALLGGPAEK